MFFCKERKIRGKGRKRRRHPDWFSGLFPIMYYSISGKGEKMNKVLKQQIEKAFKAALLDKVLQIGDNQTVYIGYPVDLMKTFKQNLNKINDNKTERN